MGAHITGSRFARCDLIQRLNAFACGCGWPAFDKIVKGAVVTATDNTLGMKRVEILCSGCGGHLGHVFLGEHATETDERHCVNSTSIKFVKGSVPQTAEAARFDARCLRRARTSSWALHTPWRHKCASDSLGKSLGSLAC